jgi:hypothetical protein
MDNPEDILNQASAMEQDKSDNHLIDDSHDNDNGGMMSLSMECIEHEYECIDPEPESGHFPRKKKPVKEKPEKAKHARRRKPNGKVNEKQNDNAIIGWLSPCPFESDETDLSEVCVALDMEFMFAGCGCFAQRLQRLQRLQRSVKRSDCTVIAERLQRSD